MIDIIEVKFDNRGNRTIISPVELDGMSIELADDCGLLYRDHMNDLILLTPKGVEKVKTIQAMRQSRAANEAFAGIFKGWCL